jgi:putative phosphoribosyl transferase
MIFTDRHEAGLLLSSAVKELQLKQPIIIALPRGGVPIGYEITQALHASLTVIVARKIGAPMRPEFGIGAIAEGDIRVLDQDIIHRLGVSQDKLRELIEKEKEELKRRVGLYRNGEPLPKLEKRTIILVDDGVATGITAQAAIIAIKKQKPKQIIFASPVCSSDTVQELRQLVDVVICLKTPVDFTAVGVWYEYFEAVTDDEVIHFLQRARRFSSVRGTNFKKSN